jgi:hypothetical protein
MVQLGGRQGEADSGFWRPDPAILAVNARTVVSGRDSRVPPIAGQVPSDKMK